MTGFRRALCIRQRNVQVDAIDGQGSDERHDLEFLLENTGIPGVCKAQDRPLDALLRGRMAGEVVEGNTNP